ncbi:MAG: aldehyde dehydrogenase family protein [Hyphomicrobiaceae bacterium]
MTIAREEIFGPVSLRSSRSAAPRKRSRWRTTPAMALPPRSSRRMRVGRTRMARAIRAGTVTVNCYGEGDATTPFGGYKTSGFGGRDKSIHAHDQYTEMKVQIWIDLSDPGRRPDGGLTGGSILVATYRPSSAR